MWRWPVDEPQQPGVVFPLGPDRRRSTTATGRAVWPTLFGRSTQPGPPRARCASPALGSPRCRSGSASRATAWPPSYGQLHHALFADRAVPVRVRGARGAPVAGVHELATAFAERLRAGGPVDLPLELVQDGQGAKQRRPRRAHADDPITGAVHRPGRGDDHCEGGVVGWPRCAGRSGASRLRGGDGLISVSGWRGRRRSTAGTSRPDQP